MLSINRKIMVMCIFFTWALVVSVFAGPADQAPTLPDEAVQNQLGMKYFKQGYYDLMPRGHKAEAHQKMDLAEKAFLRSIDINDNYIEAHRNLARLYYLQEKFDQAGAEYEHVLRLDPNDIDTHVQMAVVQTDLGHFEKAIRYLEKAKTRTADEEIIEKLDGYILKVQQAE